MESDNYLSGGYGFVAIPDTATIEKSYQLANSIFPNDSEFKLSQGNIPHITLYHSKMKNVPLKWAEQMTRELNSNLENVNLKLRELVCFGGMFIFWNVDPSDSSYGLLKSTHERALSLAKFLDKTATRRAEEEGLSLTVEEKDNVENFNHPLVRNLYLPHITLGYDNRCETLIKTKISDIWQMQIQCVRFAEIGHPGIIKHLVDF